jgi:integrase/recombinase XerD
LISQEGIFKGDSIKKQVRVRYKGYYPPRSINCQSIRQSVIANLLKQGADLRVVQVYAGHKSPGTTEKYKQSGVELLKQAIDKHHPLK